MYYNYTPEYVYKQNGSWRADMLKAIDKEDLTGRIWDLQISTMSHTPQTEQGAQDLNYNYKQLFNDFHLNLQLLDGSISYEQYLEKRNADDGKMITVASD